MSDASLNEIVSYEPEEERKESEEERKAKEELRKEQKQAILEFIKEKGITFPTEIRRNLGISKDRVYDLLWELAQEGKIKRHYVPDEPCRHFKKRMQEFWAMGIKGKGMFKRISWFVLADDECSAMKGEEQ